MKRPKHDHEDKRTFTHGCPRCEFDALANVEAMAGTSVRFSEPKQ